MTEEYQMHDPFRANQELIEEISMLKQRIQELEQSESEHKQAKEALQLQEMQLRTILESTNDGILAIDNTGSVIKSNKRFADLWEIPSDLLKKGNDEALLAYVLAQVVDPDAFQKKVHELYASTAIDFDTILFKDGRIIERYSCPLLSEGVINGRVWSFRNITDRKRAEEALRESEEKFRLLIENAPDAIYVHADARFIYLNHSAVNLFGAETADHLIGSSIMDRYDPDCHGMITKRLHDLYEERKKLPIVEQVYLRVDGSSVPVEAHAVPIPYNEKNAALTFVRDITDRKQAEEALRESEERYRGLVESASDIVFRTDGTGHFTFINPAALRITGYKENEIIGRHYPTLIRQDMREEAMKFFGRQFVKEIPNTYSEYPVIVKDGHEIWLGQNTQLIFQDGNVMAFQAVARDITDRRRVEEALRESEERYRTILENIEDGYFEVDTAGNLTFFNDSVCRMVGMTRAEMMGMNNRQYTDKENSKILYQAFNKVFRTGEPSKGVDYEIIRKDGTKLHIEASISLIRNVSGQPIGFRGVMRNITDRKRAEQEKTILADIGRLIGSTMDIDEVYERFAVEARKLIPFDRLSVNLHSPQEENVKVVYIFGETISGRNKGELFPLKGSVSEVLIKTRAGLYSHPKNSEEMDQRFPNHAATIQAGMRSLMGVPLIYRDEVIGSLHFRSKTSNAYTERYLRLAERIGAQIAGAIGSAQLFSNLMKTENSLRESEGRFRGLVEQAAVGVAEIDINTGRFLTVNRRLCEMVGRTEEELLNTTFQAITHPEDLQLHEGKTQMMLAGEIGHYSLEKRYLRKDGGIVWVNITVSPLWKPGEAPERNIAVVEDFTDRKRMEEEIREMSFRDQMTELYNRRGFITLAEQQIRAAIRNRRSMLLTFVDCDGLKGINDTLGHEEGDRALIVTANVLRQTFRKSDIIARLGGDEFAVLSIDATNINPEDFSKRLQQNIDAGNAKNVRPYKLAMSWGTAVYDPQIHCSLDDLISRADSMMYEQKKMKSVNTSKTGR
jgi:diguanylate cyclase (GGDEF)-like protein/PAS domain S-box-containing protein